ncbi:clusterin-associated protein 1 homolog [Musca vetustissima]|uniref:clusterin-associated protein 1 homolog n=1 Tax=Musca vetustissima TaxID=27455 RepID=UPI002AB7CFCE|nr:clusterin-associated protein 1 homolog [Musca vetustissima]
MSFKEVRDLAEHLKLLGYPQTFPLQALSSSFGCLASFYVVADVLQWLAGLLEPGAVLPGGVTTQDDRVLLIRSATEFFVTKSAIKLNPRKLYAASAVTAGELQKITRLLIAPASTEDGEEEEDNYRSLNQVDIGDKIEDLRRARELSSDLTQRGAVLYELLQKEMNNKEARLAQANRPMELASVERTLKNAVASAQLKLQSNRAQLENARVELNALHSKLQRKKAELERTKQRLEALQKIRPAHMQEFEEYEKELKNLFQQYFLRLHIRDALRAQFEARTKRSSPISSPLLQKANENSMPFIPEGLLADDDEDLDDDEPRLEGNSGLENDIPDELQRKTTTASNKRPGTATSRMRPTTGRGRKGTALMNAAAAARNEMNSGKSESQDMENDSSFGSSDSDFDMAELLGISTNAAGGAVLGTNDDLGDDDFDLNSMDSISISKITGELQVRPKTAVKPEHHSDEDF